MTRVPQLLAVAVCLLAALDRGQAKRFGRCELARELKSLGIQESQIADWVCLAFRESSYDTAIQGGPNYDGTSDHGLFQINDKYWCTSPGVTSHNECGKSCSSFRDDDIADDLTCAEKIYGRHGFMAWYGWRSGCKGRDLSSYTRGCRL